MRILFWLSLIVWLGGVVFFSFVAAPGIFRVLPVAEAGRVVGGIFPRYYALGTLAGVVGLVCAALLYRASGGATVWAMIVLVLTLMLGANLVASRVVHPRAHLLKASMQDGSGQVGDDLKARFDRLHRLAVQLNGAVLLLGLTAACMAASSLRPPE